MSLTNHKWEVRFYRPGDEMPCEVIAAGDNTTRAEHLAAALANDRKRWGQVCHLFNTRPSAREKAEGHLRWRLDLTTNPPEFIAVSFDEASAWIPARSP